MASQAVAIAQRPETRYLLLNTTLTRDLLLFKPTLAWLLFKTYHHPRAKQCAGRHSYWIILPNMEQLKNSSAIFSVVFMRCSPWQENLPPASHLIWNSKLCSSAPFLHFPLQAIPICSSSCNSGKLVLKREYSLIFWKSLFLQIRLGFINHSITKMMWFSYLITLPPRQIFAISWL